MPYKFENLKVWQKAMELNDETFKISKKFPIDERFNLISQIRRAADSIVLNIAEGSTSQSNPEFARFLGYSIRSVVEVACALFIAKRRDYLESEEFIYLYNFTEDLVKMLQAFKAKL
jgi:four helix bundle protein